MSNETKQRGWKRAAREGRQQDGQGLLDKIPSEQDRKAVMGCLAAVLNMMFAARQRKAAGHVSQDDAEGGADAAMFSIRENEDAPGDAAAVNSGWMTNKARQQQAERATRRTREFQRELLNASAELLFLSPDHAAVFLPNLDIKCVDDAAEWDLLLRPFLQSLSDSTESFRCIALLMFRFLLMSSEERPEKGGGNNGSGSSAVDKMTIVGYDARVRYAFKYLAASVLSFWELKEHGFMTPEAAAARATRKFEAIEDGIALRLSKMSQLMREEDEGDGIALSGQKKQSSLGQTALRGLKIGAAGVAAGTVFAITGGLAAPAIVGGIAALTGVGSAAAVWASIILLPAATTIFGVGGGTLVASKMSKRTAGLTQFDIERKTPGKGDDSDPPELSRTVCISGWLRDEHDFERPFGTSPRNLTDHHELLCRYCSVYAPHIIPHCRGISRKWEGKEDELWDTCKASCGKDPGSLLPFDAGPRYDALLSESEGAALDELMHAIGLPLPTQTIDQCSAEKSQERVNLPPTPNLLSDVLLSDNEDKAESKISDLLLRSFKAWDFSAEYGSELYIVRWERELLLDLHGTAKLAQRDLAKMAAGEALKKTAMATLMSAIFLPSALLSLSNIIDEKWTLAKERSDEAGELLAQSLLYSDAGHRPVSLIGFSFGARVIVACLKELARNQAIWEQQREDEEVKNSGKQPKTTSFGMILRNMSSKQKGVQASYSREPASIVEDVILMGCPASLNSSTWISCREIVGGRFLNCYSRHDLILALMYRVKNISQIMSPPVGIVNVNVPGIESYDVSEFVAGHGEYCVATREVLSLVGYNQPACAKAI